MKRKYWMRFFDAPNERGGSAGKSKRHLELKSGEALPVQYREFKVDRAKIDEEKRTVEILFSTDAPAERWYGKEILSHEPGACDLSRLNDGGAFLKDHNSSLQIGVHESATCQIVDGRGEGRAVVRFAPATNPLAEQEFRDVIAGVRTKISTGYVIHEMKLIEESDDDETWMITRWEPLENSLVSIPLDKACAVGRAAGEGEKFPVVVKKSLDDNRESTENDGKAGEQTMKRSMQFSEQPGERGASGSGGGNGNQPNEPTETPEQKRAREGELKSAERARVREIQAIAKKSSKVPDDVIEKAIDDGMSEDAFRKLVFEKYWGNPEPLDTPTRGGSGSGSRGEGEVREQSIGQALIASEQYKKQAGELGRGHREVRMTVDLPRSDFRATLATGAGSTLTGYQRIPAIVLLGVQRLTVADLLAQGTTTMPTVRYPRENTYTNAADMVAEGGAKPEATFDLVEVDAPVKKVAVIAKVTDEIFADFPAVQSYVDARLPFMVMQKEEQQLLNGTGAGAQITGLLQTGGIQTQATGADPNPDAIFKAITKVRTVGFFEPDGIIVHPTDWQTMKLTKDNNGQYYAGGPFTGAYGNGGFAMIDRMWGLPVVVTTAVAQGTALVGAFQLGAQIFRRQGITIETTNSNEDDFKKNLIAIRAEERFALAVYRPLAFCEVTGLA